jgi:hypothetical protein
VEWKLALGWMPILVEGDIALSRNPPLLSVEIGAAQIKAALLANHFAAVSTQLGRAIGTNRGSILLDRRRRKIRDTGRRFNYFRRGR